MDDLYAINVAKSEFRECFNCGDTSRMLAIADLDLVNLSDGQGRRSRKVLKLLVKPLAKPVGHLKHPSVTD